MNATPVVLRYFEARGRAQALRHALADGGVAFEDVRSALADWPTQKGEAGFGGPYGALPTLDWGDVHVAETLPIATFVARRLGQYDGLDDAGVARLEGVCSVCYIDVGVRAGDLIYADLLYPGADLRRPFAMFLARMVDKLACVDALVPAGGWLGGQGPVVADFFAAEAFEIMSYLLGATQEAALRRRLPSLASLAARVRGRPRVAREWQRRPPCFTARPDEAAAVERLAAAATKA